MYLKLIFILAINLMSYDVESAIAVQKFVYQKDKSEHCRRRVMPSVFLGRHVTEANSQILHFSQLEVPYSCYVSIRTESGSNLILVIQIALDDQEQICKDGNNSPVRVYEMGETFGGYWGPLPDSIIRATHSTTEHYYTIKSSMNPTFQTQEQEITDEEPELVETTTQISEEPPQNDGKSYMVVEVPILNVSGRLVEGSSGFMPKIDDPFAYLNDVTPKPGEEYRTTLMPLLQFSIGKELDARRGGADLGSDSKPRYELDFKFGDFTLDPRLTLEYVSERPNYGGKKYRYNANKRLNFRKNKTKMFMPERMSTYSHKKSRYSNSSWEFIEALLKNLTTDELKELDKENSLESEKFAALLHRIADWQHNYSAYLAPNLTACSDHPFHKSLRVKTSTATASYRTNYIKSTTNSFSVTDVNGEGITTLVTQGTTSINYVLQKENITTSSSASTKKLHEAMKSTTDSDSFHKTPDKVTDKVSSLPSLGGSTTERVIEITSDMTTKLTSVTMSTVKKVSNLATDLTTQILSMGTTLAMRLTSGSELKDQTNPEIQVNTRNGNVGKRDESGDSKTSPKRLTVTSSIMTTPVTGSMLDRESWGNVVNAAPKMAGVLNHISTTKSVGKIQSSKLMKAPKMKHRRKKRSIQAIPIDHARPHNLTTNSDVVTTAEAMYRFADINDFAQLVELQDDELHGHIALRYMRRYVGAKLFDLCSGNKNRTRLVFLFNTSRIVIALNNFTLKRMTVVATPARTLTSPEMHCVTNLLECQVAGARVCIDTMTECDGVPNCGAYDIYDEDRLRCGAGKGVHHNVYLAAFTFVAVLFTLLYTIHYWLKRCIPKVSEAFFIYTDGTENILYLDSIMRSPLGHDDTFKYGYHNNEFDEDLDLPLTENRPKKKKNIFRRIFACCFRKEKKVGDFELGTVGLPEIFKRDKIFSFPEIEISRMIILPITVDTGVQTGESLQMESSGIRRDEEISNVENKGYTPNVRKESVDPRIGFRDLRMKSQDGSSLKDIEEDAELSVMKFLRDARTVPEKSTRSNAKQNMQANRSYEPEVELKNTLYDRSAQTISSTSLEFSHIQMSEILNPVILKAERTNDDAPGTSGVVANTKRLRFDDNLTTMSSDEMKDELSAELSHEPEREPSGGSGRDFMRFWGNKGNKKSKKKSQLANK